MSGSSTTPRVPSGIQAVSAIALNTFREAVRDRILYLLVAFALVLIGSSRLLSLLTVGSEAKIVKDLGLSAIAISGVLTAVFVGVSLVYKEIEKRTLYTLLATPVRRSQFIVGKYLGLLCVLVVNVILMGTALALLVAARGESPVPLIPALLLIVMQLALVTAFAVLFSSFTNPILSALGTLAVYVVGQLAWSFDLLEARIGEGIARQLCVVVSWLTPNLDRLDLKAQAVHGLAVPPGYVAAGVLYAAGYSIAVLLVACLAFERREFLVIARRALALAVAGAALLAAGAGRAQLDRLATVEQGERPLLYLPNGKHLRAASLGHASLAADIVYLWAIQYYSDYRRADRYRFVEHVFGSVIAELDPHYVDPYWLGALILIAEARDLDAGLRLLDEGFDRNPDQWILPYLAGWECARGERYERAAAYFEAAARAPGAPAFVARMRAGMFARSGDLDEAVRAWKEVSEDPHGDAGSRAIAERQLRAIEARRLLELVQAEVDRYRGEVGRNPLRLEDLVAPGRLARLPIDPDGQPLVYDPATGEVSTAAGRMLVKR